MGTVYQNIFTGSFWRVSGYAAGEYILRRISDEGYVSSITMTRSLFWLDLFYTQRDDLIAPLTGKMRPVGE